MKGRVFFLLNLNQTVNDGGIEWVLLMKQLLPLHRTPSHCPRDVLQEACLMALSAGSVKNSRRWACLEDVLSCALFQVTGTLEALSSAQCGIVSPVFFSPQPALIVTCVLSRAASVGYLLRTSVQFSSRWYLCARKSPYALHPV